MATTRADGTTQMSPITVGVDAEDRVVVSTRETAYKVAHLRALPYAAICAFTDGFFGDWVQVEGPVDIVSLPEAMEPLVDYYRSISGEHPDWDDYRAAMERDQRVDPAHDRRARRAGRATADAALQPPAAASARHASAGHDLGGDQPQVVEVVQVEDLQVDALHRRPRRTARAVDHLGDRAGRRRWSRSSSGPRPMAAARRR